MAIELMKVLIDRNIQIFAVTHKSVAVPKSVPWGDTIVTAPCLQRVSCVSTLPEPIKEQMPYLATVCVLAKEATLELCMSHELLMERVRQKGRDRGYVGFDLLEDIPLSSLPSPADIPPHQGRCY